MSACGTIRWPEREGMTIPVSMGIHQHDDSHALHAPVLVLNASYEPINVCAARRALVLVLKGVAMTEEENGHFLHAARLAVRLPSVIRLLEYRRIPHQIARSVAKEHPVARSKHLSVLRGNPACRRFNPRPRHAALPGWQFVLGKSRGLLPYLQPPQGQSFSSRSWDEIATRTARLQPAHQPSHHAPHGTLR